jgi:hypothetical protein
VALTYPYAYGHEVTRPLLWQAEDGYSFRLLGGYAFHPDPRGKGTDDPLALEPNVLQEYIYLHEVWRARLPASYDPVASARLTISRYHVRVIIVDRGWFGASDLIRLFRRSLGAPTVSAGQFTMWTVSHQ